MSSTPATQLARLSVSLPEQLLAELDVMVEERALPSRSQMIAELIRHALAEHGEKRTSAVLAGTVTLIIGQRMGACARRSPGLSANTLKKSFPPSTCCWRTTSRSKSCSSRGRHND